MTVIDGGELPPYPLDHTDRLDSHYFVSWERRRWLNSDMRLRGTPECRALYLDLIWISYDQSPLGTLPNDKVMLAKLLMVDRDHFEVLCRLDFGPLHRWTPCQCGAEVRLYHPFVLHTLKEAIARREDNRARNEAANRAKRMQRLREKVAGYHPDLAKNDAAILWMDGWLEDQGAAYRTSGWIERAIRAWSDHAIHINAGRGAAAR
ncbi:hypothetical protein [Roseovarius pacificus]|uniref:hypothetical protein n=1 Tax=Roseovarius pacificus TaxID=337701 RepID=UPI002A188A6A|nr:hypothetical protein [Roseovarius pacificus]